MNDDEIRSHVIAALHRVAPDVDANEIDPDAELREVLQLDSIDFLTFVEEPFTRTGIDVPERDYPSLTTLARCIPYLAGHLATTQRA